LDKTEKKNNQNNQKRFAKLEKEAKKSREERISIPNNTACNSDAEQHGDFPQHRCSFLCRQGKIPYGSRARDGTHKQLGLRSEPKRPGN